MLDDFAEGSFIDFGGDDLSQTPDLEVLPDNTEAKLRLNALSVEVGQKSGKPYLLAIVAASDYPDSRDIRHMMMLPTDEDDPKQVQNRKRAIKYFGQAFGIPLTGKVDFEKYLGREAYAVLGVNPDEGYGEQNRVKRWTKAA